MNTYQNCLCTLDGISVYYNTNTINTSISVHNIIYKMTNTLNGHFYIGKHTTTNILDSYYGSGIAINDAYKTYNISVFIKEILFDFSELSDCYNKEAEIMPEISCKQNNPCCYNLKPGGYGGSTREASLKGALTRKLHGYKCSEETKYKISLANKGKQRTLEQRKYMSYVNKQKALKGKNHPMYGLYGKLNPNYGRKCSIASCEKIKINHADFSGKNNPNYGKKKMFLPNSKKGIMIPKDKIDFYIKLGYKLARLSN